MGYLKKCEGLYEEMFEMYYTQVDLLIDHKYNLSRKIYIYSVP